MGTNHRIHQGEEREQGDPLMPLLSKFGSASSIDGSPGPLVGGGTVCLPSLMTSMSFANQKGFRTCTTSWKGVCSTTHTSASTMVKPKCGKGAEGDPLGWTS